MSVGNTDLDLNLNLSPSSSRRNSSESESSKYSTSSTSSSCSEMSVEGSCVSSEPEQEKQNIQYERGSEPRAMVLVGCPRCLMYVLLSQVDPKCPRCKSSVLLTFLTRKAQTRSKQPINLTVMNVCARGS